MLVILGTAHSKSTLGKCSPDGRLKEYAYSRKLCQEIKRQLTGMGINCVIDIEGDEEYSLKNRCNIVNNYCSKYGAKNCLYVSVHVNAAGNGGWMSARGFTVWVSSNSSANSKVMAKIFCGNAIKNNLMGNRSIPLNKYWEADFYVIKYTHCPAVLTENLFQDNRWDVDFLLSEEGFKKIVDLHVNSISEYVKMKK